MLNQRTADQFTWDEFMELFLKRFQPIAGGQVAIEQLTDWKQTGSIDAYIDGFTNLSAHIPEKDLPEKTRITLFVKNLDARIRPFVQMSNPVSIADTFKSAQMTARLLTGGVQYRIPALPTDRRRENFNRCPHNYTEGSRGKPICLDNIDWKSNNIESHEGEPDSTDPPSGLNEMWLAALNPEQRQLMREGKCFTCKKRGHRFAQCPDRKNSFNQKPFKPLTLGSIDIKLLDPERLEHKQNHGKSHLQCVAESSRNNNRSIIRMNPPWLATQELKICSLEHSEVITVNGTLNGRNARLLLDSGASGNFISQSYH